MTLFNRGSRLIAALAFTMCGASCSSGTPSTPTGPSSPVSASVPTSPPVALQAHLVVADAIEFLSCVNGLCSFRGLVRNSGNACAAAISGETWIVSVQGQEVGRARWAMLPATVMRPGDAVYYQGDGMPQSVLNHLDGRYFASFVFESRVC